MVTTTNPSVRHITQPLSELCWATCVLMVREVILNKRNFDITPRVIYESMVYGGGNTPAYDDALIAALQRWGIECSDRAPRKATFLELHQAINSQQPLIIGFKGHGSSGHVVVLGGYEMKGPLKWCRVYDPAKPAAENMPFSALTKDPDWNVTFFLQPRVVNV